MTTPLVHLVAAARPNFMKVAPIWHALRDADWCRVELVHTGQHYDADMSDSFLRDLDLPVPHHQLGVGSGTHAEQTAGVMVTYEQACVREMPAWTIVVGDVNSTMACAITATKLHIPVAHLEAGLRSGDRSMPEEINRIVTDAIADLLWTPSPDADANLAHEGVPAARIERVGNVMIDSFELLRSRIESAGAVERLGATPGGYGVVTLHRPANVDDPAVLGELVAQLVDASASLPLLFPVHPRTRQRLDEHGLTASLDAAPGITVTAPLGYIEFLDVVMRAALVVTDSGGIQEETTYLGIPCLTVRPTTERPITVTNGTNRLIAPGAIATSVRDALGATTAPSPPPDLWDGHTATRVAASLRARLDA